MNSVRCSKISLFIAPKIKFKFEIKIQIIKIVKTFKKLILFIFLNKIIKVKAKKGKEKKVEIKSEFRPQKTKIK